jgi:tetratricopeptide (TPR) repeat protein
LIREGLTIRRQLGDAPAIADALSNLGSVLLAGGHVREANALYEESLPTYQAIGNRQGIADALSHLGTSALLQGNLRAAHDRHAESLAHWQALGDQQGIGWALYRLGDVALAEGDLEMARTRYRASLSLRRDLGDQWGLAESLDGLAMLAVAERYPDRGLRLAGAAAALRAAAGIAMAPVRQEQVDGWLERARVTLGEPDATTAWLAGQMVPVEDALSEALEP